MAEGATLSHIARPLALIRGLDRSRFRPLIACAPWHAKWVRAEGLDPLPLECRSSEEFLRALETGRPVFDLATLRRYAQNDLRLLGRHRPDLVIGDFRLSLSVSARRARVPYAAIANAHWSPAGGPRPWIRPVLSGWNWLPSAVLDVVGRAAWPLVERLHAAPLNRLRRENGMAPLKPDLRWIYTEADHVLYADPPALYPDLRCPDRHRFLGAVLWSPVRNPAPGPRPGREGERVYIALGSSGSPGSLDPLLRALAEWPCTAVVSTAGGPAPSGFPWAQFAPYWDGGGQSAGARLVVCNGGAGAVHQALAVGVPVLAVCRNLDQLLCMRAVEAAGAGRVLREDRLTVQRIKAALREIWENPKMRAAAGRLSAGISVRETDARFGAFLEEIFR